MQNLNMSQFFLSNGILMEIYNRKSLFNASAITYEEGNNKNCTVILRYNRRPTIVQIVEIIYFQIQNVFALTLFDGIDTLETILDSNKWHTLPTKFLVQAKLEKLIDDYKSNDMINSIDIGSVLFLCEYTFKDVSIVSESGNLQDVIVIIDFFQVGLQSLNEIKLNNSKTIFNLHMHRKPTSTFSDKEQSKAISTATNNNNNNNNIINNNNDNKSHSNINRQFSPTHTISQLALSLSPKCWLIKGMISKIGTKKEFKNQFSGTDGRLVRIQIQDHTGTIEAVAFNDSIHIVDELTLNETYIVSNASLKKSNPNFSLWSSDALKSTNHFEICITKDTNFILCTNEDSDPHETTIDLEKFNKVATLSQDTNDTYKSNKKETETQNFGTSLTRSEKYKHLIPLNEVSLKKENSFLNVIGIINKIDNLKTITPRQKEPIKLKNFYLIDQSKMEIRVAVWGKQAEEFQFNIGTILLLSKVKLTRFGGVSLSIQWETNFVEIIKECTNNEVANDLRDWWDYFYNHNIQEEAKMLKRKSSYSSTIHPSKTSKM